MSNKIKLTLNGVEIKSNDKAKIRLINYLQLTSDVYLIKDKHNKWRAINEKALGNPTTRLIQ